MVQVKKTIHVCDRCAFGRETPATEERNLILDETRYKLMLCGTHAASFDRDIAAWTHLAEESEEVIAHRSQFFTAERREETRRIRELRERANNEAARQSFVQQRAAQIDAEAEVQAFELARRTIPGAMDWRLTTHAAERMQERGFSVAEVLNAAAFPAHIISQPWRGPDVAVHQRDACRVAVNERTRAIITVIDRNSQIETAPPTNERTAL